MLFCFGDEVFSFDFIIIFVSLDSTSGSLQHSEATSPMVVSPHSPPGSPMETSPMPSKFSGFDVIASAFQALVSNGKV